MKVFQVTALFITLFISISQCEQISNFIVNGEDASVQDHPYMAKVWVATFPMCGSAILNTRSVLTVIQI
jgi:secreted trypsin-like serine protease